MNPKPAAGLVQHHQLALARALSAAGQPQPAFIAAKAAMHAVIGARLFTLMVVDEACEEAIRIFSNQPDAYPVSGRKPLGRFSGWGDIVIARRQPYIGRTMDDIRWAFFDHEQIAALGCASVLNLPVTWDGRMLGSVNMLHEAQFYDDEDIALGLPFAQLLVPAFLKALREV